MLNAPRAGQPRNGIGAWTPRRALAMSTDRRGGKISDARAALARRNGEELRAPRLTLGRPTRLRGAPTRQGGSPHRQPTHSASAADAHLAVMAPLRGAARRMPAAAMVRHRGRAHGSRRHDPRWRANVLHLGVRSSGNPERSHDQASGGNHSRELHPCILLARPSGATLRYTGLAEQKLQRGRGGIA
jgi:hypothetical protein